jgi:hypothetical protein
MKIHDTAICRNIQNNHIYRHTGGSCFINLTTGATGNIDEKTANSVLKINTELTYICNQYPIVELLIRKLELKIEKTKQP